MVVAPDDVPADHAGLFFVAGVVGALECEVPQRGELGLDDGEVSDTAFRSRNLYSNLDDHAERCQIR